MDCNRGQPGGAGHCRNTLASSADAEGVKRWSVNAISRCLVSPLNSEWDGSATFVSIRSSAGKRF